MSLQEIVQQQQQTELVTVANKISTGLAAFEKRKAELLTLRDEVDGLDIKSIEDRSSITQVTMGRKRLKSARVEIEKEGKSMRDPLTAMAKTISAKEKELIDIIEPTEKKLKEKEDYVTAEKKRIEEETKAAEKARIQSRIDRLAAYGYEIDISFIEAIGDADFEKVVENARVEHEKELAAKAEREEHERKQREQDEKDRQELQALRKKAEEAERIIREREEEVSRKEAAIKAQEERQQMEEANAAISKMKKRLEDRIDQMVNLGLRWDGNDDHYNGYGCFVPMLDMKVHSDEEWAKLMDIVTPVIARGKLQEAAKEEAEEKERQVSREKELERIRSEAAAKALEEQKEREQATILQKAEELAQASDKDKMAVVLSYIENMPRPEFKSAKHKKLFSEVVALQNKVIDHIKARS